MCSDLEVYDKDLAFTHQRLGQAKKVLDKTVIQSCYKLQ